MPDQYDNNYSIIPLMQQANDALRLPFGSGLLKGSIPHPNQPRVLLLHTDAGWTLPRHSATMPVEINAAMKEQLGLITTVLYCAYDRYQDDEREDQYLVYALENHSPDAPLPANGRWIDQRELANLDLAVPEHRPVIEAWFDEVERNEFHEQRLP